MLHGPDASLRGPCLASAREDGLPGVSARLNDQAPGADGMTACAPSPLSLALDSRRVRRRSAARDLPPGRVSFLFAVLLLCGWHSGAYGRRLSIALAPAPALGPAPSLSPSSEGPGDDGVTTGVSWITPERYPVPDASWR